MQIFSHELFTSVADSLYVNIYLKYSFAKAENDVNKASDIRLTESQLGFDPSLKHLARLQGKSVFVYDNIYIYIYSIFSCIKNKTS